MSTYLYCMGTMLAIALFGRGLTKHSPLTQWGIVLAMAVIWPIFTPIGILIELLKPDKP